MTSVPLRIGFVHHRYPPNVGGVGGIVPYLVAAVEALRQAGHEVWVITDAVPGGFKEADDQDSRVIRISPSLTGKRWSRPLLQNLMSLPRRRTAVARATGSLNLDVVEFCDFLAEGYQHLPHISARKVIRIHTPAGLQNDAGRLWDQIRGRAMRVVERRTFDEADLLIAPTPTAARAFEIHWNNRYQVKVVPNLIDTTFWCPSSQIKRNPRQMLFAGRLERLKGVDRLIPILATVLQRYPDATMHFAGSDHQGPSIPGGMSTLLRTGLPTAIQSRLHFHGPQDREQLNKHYVSSSLLLAPSRAELFGLVAAEAMACGCVPLVQQGTGLVDVVGDAGIVCDFDDAQGTSGLLASLLDRPFMVAQRSARCATRARDEFGPVTFAQRWTAAIMEKELVTDVSGPLR